MSRDLIVEQEHRTRLDIHRPDGTVLVLPVATETTTVDPATGERALIVSEHQYQTADGRRVKPHELATCTQCHALIAPQATSFCEPCQTVLCRDCAGTPPRCKPCKKNEQRKNRITLVKRAIAWTLRL
ncbi:MAG TPA: hypothetical protein VGN17_04960 [Bryobacteraceae bacterium]|jgi:hypothetical protein